MEMELSPKLATKTEFEGEGGSYYSWSASELPMLAQAKVAAGFLTLQPRGFAFPHYQDCSKLGYVLQGTCGLVGMVLPGESTEKVLKLSKGDIVAVPLGSISWWFNNGDSELVIVFLAEASTAYVPSQVSYFSLAGTLGMLSGFSAEFMSRAFNVSEQEANKLVKTQTGVFIIKLEEGLAMPEPTSNVNGLKMVFNIDEASPDIAVEKAGSVTTVGASKMDLLGQVGLSTRLVKLEANAMCSPVCAVDSADQVIYVAKGSGRVQIVGFNGKQVLDSEVRAGQMFVVPRFFVVATIAGQEGMECFSVARNSEAVLEELTTKASIWAALSPQVVRACLNVSPKLEDIFKSNIKSTEVLIPPSN